jgi:hypothetical protein
MPSIQISQQRLNYRGDAGGRHYSHANECHLLKDDTVSALSIPGHVLGHVGDVQRVGLGHVVGRPQLKVESSVSARNGWSQREIIRLADGLP